MREENVRIESAGLKLSGVVRVPTGVQPGERREYDLEVGVLAGADEIARFRDAVAVVRGSAAS